MSSPGTMSLADVRAAVLARIESVEGAKTSTAPAEYQLRGAQPEAGPWCCSTPTLTPGTMGAIGEVPQDATVGVLVRRFARLDSGGSGASYTAASAQAEAVLAALYQLPDRPRLAMVVTPHLTIEIDSAGSTPLIACSITLAVQIRWSP